MMVHATLNMDGGTIDIAGILQFGTGGSGAGTSTAHINLYGGTINVGGLALNGDGTATMDITEGVLIAAGDISGGAAWMADIGLITAYGGAGTVMVDYGTINSGATTIWAVPEPATMVLLGLGGLLIRRKR